MSGFLNSIVRGAGFTIGRNIVGDFGKRKSTTTHRYYERAENEMEKSLNFPIKGKSDTVFGNCFNMYQAFENECSKISGVSFTLLIKSKWIRYYKDCLDKIGDCKEYLELKDNNDENIKKLDEIQNRINNVFHAWIDALSGAILLLKSSKDKETARNAWFGYSDGSGGITLKELYIQTEQFNNETLIQIENHIKTFWTKLFSK